jgi:RNA polymerase sigma-70 factor (ECF subfamily)
MNLFLSANDMSTQLSFHHESDEELVFKTKSGEKQAFVELWNRHSTKILKTVVRITRNREDAEDALQDSFLKAYIHLGSFDGRSKFSTWLTRIAINSALMMLRRKRSIPETSMEICIHGEPRPQWEIQDHTVDTEGYYLRSERSRHLKRAIHRLKPVLREVVEIQQSQDYSIKEIAEAAGLSVAATKSRLLRARVALSRTLH